MNEKKHYVRKPLEEMNVIDDFLFTAIMSDEEDGLEVCRMILSCVLKREIGNIKFTVQKIVQGASEDSHGIRMDVYVTEEAGDRINVYDVEPDKQSSKKALLPKRSRYYGDLIDKQLLESGNDYDKLPELVTIFILSYDPFGKNAMYYEAGTVLKTHPDVLYNDGIRRIFLYVDGDLPDEADTEEQKLKNLLRYINESIEGNATDDNTRKLDSIVKKTKAKKDVGISYMKSWEREREIREEGRAEGLAEGLEKGIVQERIILIQRKIRKGKTLDAIVDELESTAEEIMPIYETVMKHPKDADPGEILKDLL